MRAGVYKYTTELLELEATAPPAKSIAAPGRATHRTIQEAWEPYLSSLPDQQQEIDSSECARNLQAASRVGSALDLPPAPGKTEGPATKLTFRQPNSHSSLTLRRRS